ncbi:HD-GYP domain-containing protein [Oceanobacillus sp. CAU 1775]
MRLAATKFIEPGTKLAQSIYNERGNVLLARGIEINKSMLKRLIQQGITYIYIEDEFTKDVDVEPIIPEKLRMHASKTIKDTFTKIGKASHSETRSYLLDDKYIEFRDIAGNIVDSILVKKKSVSLLTDIYISDDYIFQHSLNVAIYSTSIGLKLNLPAEKIKELAVGAILHDIGKIFIDPSILNKKEKLTEQDFLIIKKHAELGYNFLREQMEYSSVIAHCAYQHHERLDGSGYPRAIKGDDILLQAKIIAIADVFDAVTSNRVYRDAMLPHEGLELIYAGAATLFDIKIVEAFRKSIIAYPVGLTVVLHDKRVGIVIEQNSGLADRPIVRIIEEEGQALKEPYDIDLGTSLNVTITGVIKK